jgi:putative hydrolase of the HAD superfamily
MTALPRQAPLRAVLFDWGDTLMRFDWSEARVADGIRAGLEAVGGEVEDVERLAALFVERVLGHFESGLPEELEYPGLVRELLGEAGVALDEETLERYVEAEHAEWESAAVIGSATHALLESLRARGLKLGLVSNAFDSRRLLDRDMERMGLAERLDSVVFSSEVGVRKPHPEIFRRCLAELEVEPERALFVGDRLYEDVRGASELGMKTVQAVWFRADENPRGAEPDFQAFTPTDVLNVVRRLNGET